jgi:hypothetical protein
LNDLQICSSNVFFINNPDPNPDPTIRLQPDPEIIIIIISDPQNWVKINFGERNCMFCYAGYGAG